LRMPGSNGEYGTRPQGMDLTGDGALDHVAIDTTGDGQLDTVLPIVHGGKYPTIAMAKQQPGELHELSNEALAIAARDENAHDLHQERLIREIMATDEVEYPAAAEKMKEMFSVHAARKPGPIEIGGGLAGLAGIVAVPLVFNLEAAVWFSDTVGATHDGVPEIRSWANTGTWTWAWMEPMIGTASFVILCMQLGRSQFKKLAFKPFTDMIRSKRANRLAKLYPMYTRSIVKDFGRSQPLRGQKYNPLRKHWYETSDPA